MASLLAGATDADASTAAGVDRTTLWRWRTRDPAFAAVLNLRRRELWNAAQAKLRNLVPKALRTLAAALDDTAPAVRLRAAGLVLRALAPGAADPPREANAPSTADAVQSQWDHDSFVASLGR